MKNRGIILASFGDRRTQLKGILKNIRYVTGLPVVIYTDQDQGVSGHGVQQRIVDAYLWRGHRRWGVRQGNYWQAKAVLEGPFKTACCLDDDMRIVDTRFEQGFDLATKFGVCLPMNPRVYQEHNALGADTRTADRKEISGWPNLVTACNMSPMFACRQVSSCRTLLLRYLQELVHNACRGTLAIWKASWQTGITPLYLPSTWCVCGDDVHYMQSHVIDVLRKRTKDSRVRPVMLHWGHKLVQREFKKDPRFKEYLFGS